MVVLKDAEADHAIAKKMLPKITQGHEGIKSALRTYEETLKKAKEAKDHKQEKAFKESLKIIKHTEKLSRKALHIAR